MRIDGAANFRDLGGYLTRTGAMVAWGRVFRSDSLDHLTGDDVVRLDDLGLQTVIDLRLPTGDPPRSAPRARRHVLPIVDPAVGDPAFTPGVDLADIYAHALRTRAGVLCRALELVADAPQPLVFHCSAGRDWAGLLAAVLLGALGVADSDIADDYALTQTVLDGLLAPVRLSLADQGIALAPEVHTADAATMRRLLRRLEAEHGSVLGWALDHGTDPVVVGLLRDRLLV